MPKFKTNKTSWLPIPDAKKHVLDYRVEFFLANRLAGCSKRHVYFCGAKGALVQLNSFGRHPQSEYQSHPIVGSEPLNEIEKRAFVRPQLGYQYLKQDFLMSRSQFKMQWALKKKGFICPDHK